MSVHYHQYFVVVPRPTEDEAIRNIMNGHDVDDSMLPPPPPDIATNVPTTTIVIRDDHIMLKCSGCGQEKPLDAFEKDSTRPWRYYKRCYCKACRRASRKSQRLSRGVAQHA